MSNIHFTKAVFDRFKPILPLAKKVSARVEIDSLCLIDSTLRRTIDLENKTLPEDIQFNVSADTTVTNRRIDVVVSFALDSGDEPVVKISAKFKLAYRLDSPDDLEDADYQAFGLLNGVYNTWPYWREFVQSSLCRMDLPSFAFPVFNPLSLEAMVREDLEKAQ